MVSRPAKMGYESGKWVAVSKQVTFKRCGLSVFASFGSLTLLPVARQASGKTRPPAPCWFALGMSGMKDLAMLKSGSHHLLGYPLVI